MMHIITLGQLILRNREDKIRGRREEGGGRREEGEGIRCNLRFNIVLESQHGF